MSNARGNAPEQTGGTSWPFDFDAVLGLGSNMGDKAANLAEALTKIASLPDTEVVRASRLYRSAPWGVTDQDWFVNGCVAVKTGLEPRELLRAVLEIEQQMKRIRLKRWGPRIIDIDLLVYRSACQEDVELSLPHPRMTERGFVMVPFADIAPDLNISGKSVSEWCEMLATDDLELHTAVDGWPTS